MLVATLIDVAPDGTTTSVYRIWEPDGVLLGTARAVDPSRSWYDTTGGPIFAYHPFTIGTQEPVTPGQTVAMDITLTPRMWAVLPGHRLRLQITTQAPTLLAPTQPQIDSLTGATFSIARNSQDPSYLNLPVVPLNAFTPDPAYGQTSYTDEPQDPAGVGSVNDVSWPAVQHPFARAVNRYEDRPGSPSKAVVAQPVTRRRGPGSRALTGDTRAGGSQTSGSPPIPARRYRDLSEARLTTARPGLTR